MKKTSILVWILFSLTDVVNCQSFPVIDFSNYLTTPFNSTNCTYTFGSVPMQLYNFAGQQFCNPPQPTDHVFEAKIQREDIPYTNSSNMIISSCKVTCIGTSELLFNFVYNNGTEITVYDSTATIDLTDSLDYITVREIECGLLYGNFGAVQIFFSKTSNVNEPAPNSCNDITIDSINSLLVMPELSCDYHYYEIEDVICTDATYSGQASCSVTDVFNFIKSNNIYQAPIYSDFPEIIGYPTFNCNPGCDEFGDNPDSVTYNPYSLIDKALTTLSFSGPYNVPIENCMEMQLTPSFLRLGAGVILNSTIPQFFNLCGTYTDVANEPIKIVIDEENKCITNYTMPGHILYPGKVERCVVSSDCDKTIKVITKGIGFHFCGDDWGGAFFGCMNKKIGTITFHNVSERLKVEFNN